MAKSLFNYIAIFTDGSSKIYAATSISNVLDSIGYNDEPQSIIRLELYSGRCNNYEVQEVNYNGS